MIYEFKTRIRYSEVDKKSRLTFSHLLGLFQDTSVFHGEDNGASMAEMTAEGITWVLAAWQVRLFGEAKLGDMVTPQTWAYRFRRCIGYRNFRLLSAGGEVIADASGQYALINIKTKQTENISKALADKYTTEPDMEIRDMDIERKIPVSDNGIAGDPIPVEAHMIDTNRHVNNLQFVTIAVGLLEKYNNFKFNRFRAEYKKQAFMGDVFYPVTSESENGYQVRLCGSDGDLYFIGEWYFKED